MVRGSSGDEGGCTPREVRWADTWVRYPDGTLALQGVDVTVRPGERVALLGPNGAGKSTLLLVGAGFLPPSSGAVTVGGLRVGPPTIRQIRRWVGIMFQDPDDQLFCPTVGDDVEFGPRNQGLEGARLQERVDWALRAVALSHLRDRPPHRLSVGEKTKAALAAVLAMNPSVLFLDEPTSSLDGASRANLANTLQTYPGTMVIASQDLAFVASVCDRAVVLAGGRVALDVGMGELLADRARLRRLGLASFDLCDLCAAHGWARPGS